MGNTIASCYEYFDAETGEFDLLKYTVYRRIQLKKRNDIYANNAKGSLDLFYCIRRSILFGHDGQCKNKQKVHAQKYAHTKVI
eukprot:15228920-Ditylum_brightwellii.AAC.1